MCKSRLVTWRGKPIDEMPRQELIDALNFCARRLSEEMSVASIHAESIGRLRRFRGRRVNFE